jgi:hypothetical protein
MFAFLGNQEGCILPPEPRDCKRQGRESQGNRI